MSCACSPPQVLWDGFLPVDRAIAAGQSGEPLDFAGLSPVPAAWGQSWFYEIWIHGLNQGTSQGRVQLNDGGPSNGPEQGFSNSPAFLRCGPQARRLRIANPAGNSVSLIPYILIMRHPAQ